MNRVLHILFAICCLAATGAQAQSVKMLLTGSVYNPVDGLASYLVSFTVTNGNISGYSITDYENNNPLRTPITGRLEPNGRLYIRELPTNDNNAGPLAGTYCYFTASLSPSTARNTRSWSGAYASGRVNGSPCTGGNMVLYETAPQKTVPDKPATVNKPAPPAPQPVRVPQPAPSPAPPRESPMAVLMPLRLTRMPVPRRPRPDIRPVRPPDREAVTRVTPGGDSVQYDPLYLWDTDSLVLEIWDGFWQDGDAISISWNGRLVKEEYAMGAEKVRLALPLQGMDVHTLAIYLAEDGGAEAITPNAAFYDGPKQHQLHISGKKGQTARIYFRKRRPGELTPPK